jgi:hypothetical protein
VPSEWPRPTTADPFCGEAVVLWRLRNASGNLRCFAAGWPRGFWLGVECAGGGLVLSETLSTIDAVMARAAEVKAPLLEEGWLEE